MKRVNAVEDTWWIEKEAHWKLHRSNMSSCGENESWRCSVVASTESAACTDGWHDMPVMGTPLQIVTVISGT